MRKWLWLVLVGLLASFTSAAAQTNTSCSWFGNSLDCTTTPTPPDWTVLAERFWQQSLWLRAQREQQQLQQQLRLQAQQLQLQQWQAQQAQARLEWQQRQQAQPPASVNFSTAEHRQVVAADSARHATLDNWWVRQTDSARSAIQQASEQSEQRRTDSLRALLGTPLPPVLDSALDRAGREQVRLWRAAKADSARAAHTK